MTYSIDLQVAELKRWVGFHEGYNNSNPFSVWQGYGTRYLPWCDSFAQYCAVQAGGFVWHSPYAQFGPKGSGYVPTSIHDAQAMGIWRSPGTRARPGWQAIYDWSWDGVADHIETCIQDDGDRFVTIGGNTSDAVMYKTRDRKYLVGWIALDEAGQTGPPPPPIVIPDPKPSEGKVVDWTHAHSKTGEMNHKAGTLFQLAYDIGVQVGAVQATILGPIYEVDGAWPHTRGATVRVQARGTKAIATVDAPHWQPGMPLPAVHILAVPA